MFCWLNFSLYFYEIVKRYAAQKQSPELDGNQQLETAGYDLPNYGIK